MVLACGACGGMEPLVIAGILSAVPVVACVKCAINKISGKMYISDLD